ncbi:MAG: hypothetical protein R3E18_10250 [Sphingomonadaceae bacterium]
MGEQAAWRPCCWAGPSLVHVAGQNLRLAGWEPAGCVRTCSISAGTLFLHNPLWDWQRVGPALSLPGGCCPACWHRLRSRFWRRQMADAWTQRSNRDRNILLMAHDFIFALSSPRHGFTQFASWMTQPTTEDLCSVLAVLGNRFLHGCGEAGHSGFWFFRC